MSGNISVTVSEQNDTWKKSLGSIAANQAFCVAVGDENDRDQATRSRPKKTDEACGSNSRL